MHAQVTLGVPWLVDEDQEKVYPKGKRYETKEDQVRLKIPTAIETYPMMHGRGSSGQFFCLLFVCMRALRPSITSTITSHHVLLPLREVCQRLL